MAAMTKPIMQAGAPAGSGKQEFGFCLAEGAKFAADVSGCCLTDFSPARARARAPPRPLRPPRPPRAHALTHTRAHASPPRAAHTPPPHTSPPAPAPPLLHLVRLPHSSRVLPSDKIANGPPPTTTIQRRRRRCRRPQRHALARMDYAEEAEEGLNKQARDADDDGWMVVQGGRGRCGKGARGAQPAAANLGRALVASFRRPRTCIQVAMELSLSYQFLAYASYFNRDNVALLGFSKRVGRARRRGCRARPPASLPPPLERCRRPT
jgi:hypothetical protein